MNLSLVMALLSGLPKLIQAVEAIAASEPAKTVEQQLEVFWNHNTAGKENAAALGPDATPPAT